MYETLAANAFGSLDDLGEELGYLVDAARVAYVSSTAYPRIGFMLIGTNAIGELKATQQWDHDRFVELMISKQHDYGHKNITAFGLFGVIVRLSDKVARLANLVGSSATARNEAITDTWTDIVGYCIIAEMLFDNMFTLPLGETT